MAIRKRQKRKGKVDTTLRPENYALTLIYSFGDTAYVGSTNMIREGETFTSEDSHPDMWITSTEPAMNWTETRTREIL